MGKFERETLPKALEEAQKKVEKLEREQWEIAGLLDADDDASEHKCDCEHCDIAEDQLSSNKRAELEQCHAEAESELETLKVAVKRMTAYRAYAKKVGTA